MDLQCEAREACIAPRRETGQIVSLLTDVAGRVELWTCRGSSVPRSDADDEALAATLGRGHPRMVRAPPSNPGANRTGSVRCTRTDDRGTGRRKASLQAYL
jgi:hypothetical protein